MNWITVKKFPLDTDLSHVTGYLREQKIVHKIYEEAGSQVVVVADPRMVGPIRHFLEEIEQGRLVIQTEPQQQTPESSLTSAPGLLNQIADAPVTSALIALSILGALMVRLDPGYSIVHGFLISDSTIFSRAQVFNLAEPWRLVTPAFLHFGFVHVLFNSLWMWDLGRRFEFLLGHWMLIIFFAITAALSNLAQYVWAHDPNFGGMSGVVYALVGFIMVSHKLRPHHYTSVPAVVIGTMLFWLVLCMTGAVDFFIGGGVANAAHLGGLISGCLFALLPVKPNSSNN